MEPLRPLRRVGSISHVLSEARASLKNPSRPFTPRDRNRSLFTANLKAKGAPPLRRFGKHGKMDDKDKDNENDHGENANDVDDDDGDKDDAHGSEDEDDIRRSQPNEHRLQSEPGDAKRIRARKIRRSCFHSSKEEDTNAEAFTVEGLELENVELAKESNQSTWVTHGNDWSNRTEEGATFSLLTTQTEADGDQVARQSIKTKGLGSSCNKVDAASAWDDRGMEKIVVDVVDGGAGGAGGPLESPSRSSESSLSDHSTEWDAAKRQDEHNDIKQMIIQIIKTTDRANAAMEGKSQIEYGLESLKTFAQLCTHLKCIIESEIQKDESFVLANKSLSRCCRQMFERSQKDENDEYFLAAQNVEVLLRLLETTVDRSKQKIQCSFLKYREFHDDFDTFVYLAGILKNISSNERTQKVLILQGGIATISGLLALDRSGFESTHPNEREEDQDHTRLLIQITETIRNLAVTRTSYKQFQANETIEKLTQLIPIYLKKYASSVNVSSESTLLNETILLNIARVFGKLSLHEDGRAQLNQSRKLFRNLLDMLSESTLGSEAIVLRTAFTLGNLVSSSDKNRQKLCIDLHGNSVIVNVFADAVHAFLQERLKRRRHQQFCSQQNEQEVEKAREARAKEKLDDDGNDGRNDASDGHPPKWLETQVDVLTKLIRLVANLAVNEKAGAILARTKGIESLADLVTFLVASPNLVEEEDGETSPGAKTGKPGVRVVSGTLNGSEAVEELVLNCTSCVTNLSAWWKEGDDAWLQQPSNSQVNLLMASRLQLTQSLLSFLLHPNHELVIESARAIGNLSRFQDVRLAMLHYKSTPIDVLLTLLDHSNVEILLTVGGVLMNLANDPATRTFLVQFQPLNERGSPAVPTSYCWCKLIEILRSTGLRDLELSTILCKVLYNLSLDTISFQEKWMDGKLLSATLEELIDVLTDDIDAGEENLATASKAPGSKEYPFFVHVAESLYQRVQSLTEKAREANANPHWVELEKEPKQ